MRTNLEACREIAVQTRLRSLGGIILADMIDLKSDEDRGRVIAEMREAFANDRVKTAIHGFTSLGILEMTRKRGSGAAQLPDASASGREIAAESGADDGGADDGGAADGSAGVNG